MNVRISFGAAAVIAITAFTAAPSRAAEETVAGIKAELPSPTELAEPQVENWGTSNASLLVIHGLGFQESDSGMAYSYSSITTQRYKTAGLPWFDAEVKLPAGAQLVGLELEGCDTNATQHVALFLFRRGAPAGPTSVVHSLSSGDAATPGCALFGGPANIPAGQFVDNGANSYFVRAEVTGTTDATSLGSARIYYKLRVSPGPAVATFSDIPTSNPLFRFVEALAAAGITGGCGGGNFCADAPLTRGQMAVFLSSALGLHFPN